MYRTHAALRSAGAGPPPRLQELAREHQEWRSWIGLLELVWRAQEDPIWAGADVSTGPEPGQETPLLHGAVITLGRRRAGRWVRRILSAARRAAPPGEAAAGLRGAKLRRVDGLRLLEATLREDEDSLVELAAGAGPEPRALGPAARLAAMPLLHACRQRLATEIPRIWWRGYCPVCGGWPAMAEMRGLDRERHLRCGGCGSDWRMPVLRCPFCDEKDHTRMGSLIPEGEEERRRIDVCESCKGYMKTVNTLTAIPEREVTVEDLATVELDIVALERGYRRPERSGYAPNVSLAGRSGLRRLAGIRR